MLKVLEFPEVINLVGKIYKVEKFNDSNCNEVYHLFTQNGEFVLKIAFGHLRKNELDNEFQVVSYLKKKKFNLPEMFLYKKCEEFSFILMQYIKGNKIEQFSSKNLRTIAHYLKKIHSLDESVGLVNYDKLLCLAESNLKLNRIDMGEFVRDGVEYKPEEILQYLKKNQVKVKACLLHGDFRPKNMILRKNKLFLIDWSFSYYGDPYYDLAIIKWYFTHNEFAKFLKYYGLKDFDEKRLIFNEWLSAFLNV